MSRVNLEGKLLPLGMAPANTLLYRGTGGIDAARHLNRQAKSARVNNYGDLSHSRELPAPSSHSDFGNDFPLSG